MTGPSGVRKGVHLADSQESELVWITEYSAQMVAPNGKTRMSQEFMYYNTLGFDINMIEHSKRIGGNNYYDLRLFTLSQGQFTIRLPEGFGIPVFSDERLRHSAQIFNLNDSDKKHSLRHKINVEFIRDKDLTKPMKPLFLAHAYGYAFLEGEQG